MRAAYYEKNGAARDVLSVSDVVDLNTSRSTFKAMWSPIDREID